MRFLGDMGVSWRVIEWLRAGGAATTRFTSATRVCSDCRTATSSTSLGLLPPGITVADLKRDAAAQLGNPLIAGVLSRRGLIE
jgi:hypothetical protein